MLAGAACCLWTSCGGAPTDSGSSDGVPDDHPSFEELFGSTLVKADGREVDLRSVRGKALVGIYFASGSCSACGAFTPQLVGTYGELKAAGRSFEIVLASLDGSSEDMLAFMQQHGMEWVAMPYDYTKVLALADRYGVALIPTLVIIDDERNTITKKGREDVVSRGAGAYDVWLDASQRLKAGI